jgi:hypothetical protein
VPDFRVFPPVGQNDFTSCWAACLSWWLRANARKPSSQNDLIVEFNGMTEDDGTITLDTFMQIAATPRFMMQAAKFEIDTIQEMRNTGLLPITDTPNIIVFNKFLTGPGVIGMHMNVVFDQRGPDDNKIVTCMEPAFPDPGSDGQRTGKFVDVEVSTFLKVSPIVIACAS